MVAAVSAVGVIVHAVEVHAPDAAADRHVPANALIVVGVGVCGVGDVTLLVAGVLLHAVDVRRRASRTRAFGFTVHFTSAKAVPPARQLDGSSRGVSPMRDRAAASASSSVRTAPSICCS